MIGSTSWNAPAATAAASRPVSLVSSANAPGSAAGRSRESAAHGVGAARRTELDDDEVGQHRPRTGL